MTLPTPLYILANEKKLPANQYMDSATLEWIKQGEKIYFAETIDILSTSDRKRLLETMSSSLKELSLYLPISQEWFARGNASLTLHGELHAYRVALLAGMLASERNDTKSAVIAGLFHDIARINDQADDGHGPRSANWLAKNYGTIGSKLYPDELDVITGAIAKHEQPADPKDTSLTINLQVADALDRFRLPKLKWWPNPNLMAIHPTPSLLKFAYLLVIYSEDYVQTAGNPHEAFTKAVHKLTEKLSI